MAAVNLPRVASAAVVACAVPTLLLLAGCGSADDSASATTTATTTALPDFTPLTGIPPAASECPPATPEAPTPQWTLDGASGSIAVTGPTDTTAPIVEVNAPFSVNETQVHTLQAGDGPVVADTATVYVCYLGVNGRDGNTFDSTYEWGSAVSFPLDQVVPGFQKAIAGQTVGSSVAVAMVPADGYPQGQPAAGIEPDDTLVFAIKILDASS